MTRGILVALAGLLFVGAWLAWSPLRGGGVERTPGAHRFEWIVGNRAYEIEMREIRAGTGEAAAWEYRFLDRPELGDGWLAAHAFQQTVRNEANLSISRNWLLKAVNASSWRNFLWVIVGLGGQLCFFGRMFIQWLASERQGASVVPPVFWWLSLAGGLALLGYFVWRRDPIGILGQSTGTLVYARNLWLIHRGRGVRRAAGIDPAPGA